MLTNYAMRPDFVILALDLKFSKTNWLIISTHKPPSLSEITITSKIKKTLTFYRSTRDSILLMGDCNMTLDNPNFN